MSKIIEQDTKTQEKNELLEDVQTSIFQLKNGGGISHEKAKLEVLRRLKTQH